MLASGRVFSVIALSAAALSLLGCSNRQGQCITAGCWDAAATTTTDSTTDTTATVTMTETTTSEPDLCGDGVVGPGEKCDDGDDCGDGLCNSDDYTGVKHCNAECGGLYPGWCGDKAMQGTEVCDDGVNTPTCDEDCTTPECGDGLFNPAADETCDDGDDNSDAYDDTPDQVACNKTCTGQAPHCGDGICQEQVEDGMCADCSCGDGITSPPEVCDEGMNDTPACDADCTAVKCGDGHPNPAAGESCDDGNTDDTDECRSDCTTCGDGTPQAGEECDDGNDVDDDACSNTCIKPRLVFVTSTTFPGNLGGLGGADMKCAAAGMTAAPNLPASAWRAWLSDDTGSPSTRFDTTFTGWYHLVDGTPVAHGWSDLTDGTLLAAISLTEANAPLVEPTNVWSNTSTVGTKQGAEHCNNWTNSTLVVKGRLGEGTAMDANWSDLDDAAINPYGCGTGLHLYCFQQSP